MLRRISNKVISYPRIGLWVTLFHCLYVITWYMQLGSRRSFLGDIRIEFVLAAGLILVSFFYLPIKPPSPLQGRILKPVILFTFFALLAVPFSYNIAISWQIFIDRLIKFAFMAYFIIVFVRGPLQLKFFLAAFMLAWMKIGQESFLGVLTGSMMWENQGVMRLHGTTGLFQHPNSLAGLAIGTLPFIYYLFPLVSRPVKAFFGMQTLFVMTMIIYSGSRTAYLSFLAFIFFVFLKSWHKVNLLAGMLLIGILLQPFLPTQYIERFETIFTGKDKEGKSMESRKRIIREELQIFEWHPLGVGLNAMQTMRRTYFGRSEYSHNLYTQVATDLGIQGLISFMILIYAMMKYLRYIQRSISQQIAKLMNIEKTKYVLQSQRRHVNDLILMKATAEAVYVFVAIRLVAGIFGGDLYEIYWWFGIGLTIALLNMDFMASKETQKIIQETCLLSEESEKADSFRNYLPQVT